MTKGQGSGQIDEKGALKEPLDGAAAKRLAAEIIRTGDFAIRPHAREEMAKDGLETSDCIRIIKSGFCEGKDLIDGTWRYRFSVGDGRTKVVIAFRNARYLVIVTAWKDKQ